MGVVLHWSKGHTLFMEQTTKLHVVLGAGQVGTLLRERLVARGERVRVVQRSASTPIAGVEQVRGDITNLDFAERATEGAAVVYDCMNPLYHQWKELLVPLATGSLHGATKAGAKLVALDCLYMYGKPKGPMTEDTEMVPCSKKGELRVALHHLRMNAHRSGSTRVAIARASDFIGPDLGASYWSPRFFERVLAGKTGECFGDPEMPHSYTYANDVADALATLGDNSLADGRVWHVPTNAPETTQAIGTRFGKTLGIDVRMARVPKLAVRAAGLFIPMMRELAEMTYQWEVPFVIDDTRFRQAFGASPTPMDVIIERTAEWARSRFITQRAA